jgi:hypothetical protein
MLDLPTFVRRVVVPILYVVGHAVGKYRKYADAPTPVTPDSRAHSQL